MTVKNVGHGRSFDTQANVRNLSGDGLLLHEGRFDISNMNPGDTKKVAFTFDVDQISDPEAKVWDLAPLKVIVEEAGGRFTDMSGSPVADGGSGLATNGHLHAAALAIVGE